MKCGRGALEKLNQIYWNALAAAVLISLVEFVLVLGLVVSVDLSQFSGTQAHEHENSIRKLLVLGALLNLLWMPVAGLPVRLLYVFGYYPRLALWGLFHIVTAMVVPAIAVAFGFNFFTVGASWILAKFVTAMLALIDVIPLMRRKGVGGFVKPNARGAFSVVVFSQLLTIRDILNMLRQHGVRIIMGGYLGSADVAIFSTNRTIANIIHQGIASITNPLLPELMESLNRRDHDKVVSYFSIIWLVLLIVVVPCLYGMQIAISPLFNIWTQGKVAFDPLLFAIFSGTILFFIAGQPAFAILSGNNVLKSQLYIVGVVSLVAIIGLVILVPHFGVHGAAASLLIAEIVSTTMLSIFCSWWMKGKGLFWPWPTQRLVLIASLTGVSILVINSQVSMLTSAYVSVLASILSLYLGCKCYKTLPLIGQTRIASFLANVKTVLLQRPCSLSK